MLATSRRAVLVTEGTPRLLQGKGSLNPKPLGPKPQPRVGSPSTETQRRTIGALKHGLIN